jgi:hypothetical protein
MGFAIRNLEKSLDLELCLAEIQPDPGSTKIDRQFPPANCIVSGSALVVPGSAAQYRAKLPNNCMPPFQVKLCEAGVEPL